MAIGDTSCTGIAGAELHLKKRLLACLGIQLVLGVQWGDLVRDLVEDLVGETNYILAESRLVVVVRWYDFKLRDENLQ